MSEISETSPTPASQPPALKADLEKQLADLRGHTIKLQSGLIALTWLMIFFMFLQVWRGHKDVVAARSVAVQWNKIIENGNARIPMVQKFLGQLVEFSQTHPDIKPILAKYPIQVQTLPTPTPGATNKPTSPAPTPAPATPPKK